MTLSEAMFFKLLTLFGQAFLTDVDVKHNYVPETEYAEQMYCLSVNTYHETRGESFEGKLAVAQSVMSRVRDESGEFRNYDTPCAVVYRSNKDVNGNPLLNECWYSWYCDGKPDTIHLHSNGKINKAEQQAWRESILVSFYAYHDLHEPVVDSDVTHYYNYTLVNPRWAPYYEVVGDVGEHRFLKAKEEP